MTLCPNAKNLHLSAGQLIQRQDNIVVQCTASTFCYSMIPKIFASFYIIL